MANKPSLKEFIEQNQDVLLSQFEYEAFKNTSAKPIEFCGEDNVCRVCDSEYSCKLKFAAMEVIFSNRQHFEYFPEDELKDEYQRLIIKNAGRIIKLDEASNS
jgi:hypothetical protein